MGKNRSSLFGISTICLGVCLAGSLSAGVYGNKKIKVKNVKSTPAKTPDASVEPDKVLYDKAVESIKHSKYTEGRLEYQTLINTYPDSEYLAKAKLGTADSYYKEGGTSNFTQAIAEYKSFIVFFPFLDESAYAQMQVGMCHYRMMEKSDRDASQAEAAEDEFQTFLLKYPQSPLVPKAEQDLRDVQEVLADGEYRIGRFYFLKPDYPAAAARLVEVAQRYPLYSQSDDALWMLGTIYDRAKQASKNEDDKNHWADLAAKCYDRILRDYPLSEHAGEAKARLTAMGMAVPPADPNATKRMQNDQRYADVHRGFVLTRFPKSLIESKPDVMEAARAGDPNLNPPDDALSATDVLRQGAAGPSFDIVAKPVAPSTDNAGDNDTPVETGVTDTDSTAPSTTAGAEIIEAPGANTTANGAANGGADPAGASSAGAANGDAAAPASSSPTTVPPSASTLSGVSPDPSQPSSVVTNSAAPAAQPAAAAPAAASSTSSASKSSTSTGTSQGQSSQTTASSGSAQSNNQSADSKDDAKNESSSKKKKGIHKIIPL